MGTVETPAEYAPDCVFSLPEDEIAVDAVVSFYAPSDISATGYERRTDLVPLDDADDAFFQRYSPLYQVDEDDDTPFLMVHGEDDEIVPLSESEALVAALDEAGIRAELVVIEDGGHDPQEWDDDVYFDVLFRLVLFVDRLGDVDADI
jgi:dipeptidyl aminopeptidase/acylaminoacyl peptidase